MGRRMAPPAAPSMSQMDGDSRNIPPSTISALVQHQTRAKTANGPSQNGGDDQLAIFELLRDIQTNPQEHLSGDAEEHRLLVQVLVQVLLGLARDAANPLSTKDRNVERACRCLDVICMTLKRTPIMLFQKVERRGHNNLELCLWMLPRLFTIILDWQDWHVHESVQKSLSVCLNCVSGSFRFRKMSASLQSFYKICIEDLLTAIDAASSTNAPNKTFELAIPSAEATNAGGSKAANPIVMDAESQVRPTTIEQAVVVATHLVTALAGSYVHKARGSRPAAADIAGTVQMLERLWHRTRHALIQTIGDAPFHLWWFLESIRLFLGFVKNLSSLHPLAKERMFQLTEDILLVMLANEPMQSPDTVQIMVAYLLNDIAHYHRRSPQLREAANKTLAPGCELEADLREALQLVAGWEHNALSGSNPPPHAVAGIARPPHPMAETNEVTDISPRPLKRQKLANGHVSGRSRSDVSGGKLLEQLCTLLGNWDRNDLIRLCRSAPGMFSDLAEPDREEILRILAQLPHASNAAWLEANLTNLYAMVCNLLHTNEVRSSKRLRIAMAMVVQNLVPRLSQGDHLDVASSPLGTWCLQSLRSSVRQIRIKAATILPKFVQTRVSDEIRRKNSIIILDTLRQLIALNDLRLLESLIMAMGQMARVCENEERAIALNHLVELLGHTSKLVCDMAFLELKAVSSAVGCASPLELLNPFWNIIGITVVKDLLTRPQKVQQIADLVGARVEQFLLHVQADVLPWLVLEKRQDILVRLAKARGANVTPGDICLNRRNLPHILAAIITQHPGEIEGALMTCLTSSGADVRGEDPAALLKIDTIAVACEILKIAGDKQGIQREEAAQGFHAFTVLVEKRSQQVKAASTQARLSTLFFEDHALGILNSFSTVIDSEQATLANKRRCLNAIEQMIVAGQANIVVALPQIRACLQSAMQALSLRDSAFMAWLRLLTAVKTDDELESLTEQTFALLVQYWQSFSPQVQQLAYDNVSTLIKDHSNMIQEMIASLPSLAAIPLMSKFETQLARFRDKLEVSARLQAFTQRCQDENAAVVLQALRELSIYLKGVQEWIHESAITEQPSTTIADLMRSLLDANVRYKEQSDEILDLTATCIGTIGCLDPNRVDTIREKSEMVLLSNFEEQSEAVQFVTLLLDSVLVTAFHSVSNPRAQGFLAYVMQELLRFCGFDKEAASPFRPHGSQNDEVYQRWMQMSEKSRSTLTPFLSSHYVLTTQPTKPAQTRQPSDPMFPEHQSHGAWLRALVLDLLQRPKGDNTRQIFGVLSRVIRGYDLSIAAFILPFAAANIVLGGTEKEAEGIGLEILSILQRNIANEDQGRVEYIKSASESIFQVLDYLSRYVQEKKKALHTARSMAARTARPMSEIEEQTFLSQIAHVERVLNRIPAEIISRRAVECGSYARAYFHWEQHMRDEEQRNARPGASTTAADKEQLYQQLQDIYGQIEEPDGIDGISTYLHVLNPEQQVLEHRRAGRWSAAQSWYEIRLKDDPENMDLQIELLQCLRNSGQHQLVLDHANNIGVAGYGNDQYLSIMSEAAWTTRDWDGLREIFTNYASEECSSFNVRLGAALVALNNGDRASYQATIKKLRLGVAKTMSQAATTSLQACHDQLLKLHTLHDAAALVDRDRDRDYGLMDRRLNVVGSYISDKQYLLNVRRAIMYADCYGEPGFYGPDTAEWASTWLLSGKLARKEKWSNIAYEAVLNAAALGDERSKVEQAKLLWNDGEHNKAIRSLETAIQMNVFSAAAGESFSTAAGGTAATARDGKQPEQNFVVARAHLLLAKWLDAAGQTQSSMIQARYQQAARSFTRWEKGLYCLGRFYNKLLESEKALPLSKQNTHFLSGDTAKLVIENFLRSLMYGTKYIFESVPKLLTLWLDFGIEVSRPLSKEVPDDVKVQATRTRPVMLDTMNKQVKKYHERLPPYIFYTALAQMITRMGHPNKEVYDLLAGIIVKVVSTHPQQGLWPLLAVVKSTAKDRTGRANAILNTLMGNKRNSIRNEGQNIDLKGLVSHGQKLSNQLLHACEVTIGGRSSIISLTKDMGFNGKVAPCPLVVPVDQHLSASLPATTMNHAQVKTHRAFPASREAVTISSFQDDVLVLNSLQRPRKLTVRGSDGRKYGLLCKPNDDLRKDQRLMEFNGMINRALKKDAESSKRRLYIRTYAVTPLNEACGLIEWVDGLKPIRDILLTSYRHKGTKVDYGLLRDLLNDACSKDNPEGYRIFSEQIQPMYEPVLHEWFTEYFPSPESWFNARLRYARSAAVTSMQGYALGLGDRHGENVLLEENSGGVFHVDFNCLFEKGLTFDKPELVPFRLTRNMVDAMGAYGYEGPFRRSAECAMRVMRAKEDALLTILETFVYDPTADFVGVRKRPVKGVPETPKEVLESVKSKLRGLLRGESVPLSVGGHVDALIKLAVDPRNLCAMYIGWCAFL